MALSALMAVVACTKIPTETDTVLSLEFDLLPSPSIVLGDTLRDTAGVARRLSATVFNFQGDIIPGAPVVFASPDRGIRINPTTGFVIGDSLRATPARVVATIAGLQAVLPLDITLRPDTVVASNGRDSLGYSLTDTTRNVSPVMSVRLLHGLLNADSSVKSYVVSFAVTSSNSAGLATLVNDAGRDSRVDTTDASGIAGRKLRVNAARLSSLVDSVIVQATVKYRGNPVRGSPVRLVLRLRPGSP